MAGLPPLSPRPSPYAQRKSYQQGAPIPSIELDSSICDLNKALNHFRKRAVLEEDVRQIFERQDDRAFESSLRKEIPHKIPRSTRSPSKSSSIHKQVQFLDHPEVFIIPMDRDWISSRRCPISLF